MPARQPCDVDGRTSRRCPRFETGQGDAIGASRSTVAAPSNGSAADCATVDARNRRRESRALVAPTPTRRDEHAVDHRPTAVPRPADRHQGPAAADARAPPRGAGSRRSSGLSAPATPVRHVLKRLSSRARSRPCAARSRAISTPRSQSILIACAPPHGERRA